MESENDYELEQRFDEPGTIGDDHDDSQPEQRGFAQVETPGAGPSNQAKPPPLPEPTVKEMIKSISKSRLNFGLLALPAAWILHFMLPEQDVVIFILCCAGIIPLAKMLATATEELSLRVGETLAGLINATLGNAVELIVAILALIKCELRIVQSSLIGSMLSNLLLVLGFCFTAGGVKFSQQGFAIDPTGLNMNLVLVSVIAILTPTMMDVATKYNGLSGDSQQVALLKLSYVFALNLLGLYGAYLYFQLVSHKEMYSDDAEAKKSIPYSKVRTEDDEGKDTAEGEEDDDEEGQPKKLGIMQRIKAMIKARLVKIFGGIEEEEVGGGAELTLIGAIVLLVVVTVVVAITAEFLVDSINGLASSGKISKEFIGLILLPIVGNAAEHVTAVTVSVKDKLTLSTSVAVGSTIQIALFVIPFSVVIGWITGHPLSMVFDPIEAIVLLLSVLLVFFILHDGKSNWLEGVILLCAYSLLSAGFWFYPGSELTGRLTCTA